MKTIVQLMLHLVHKIGGVEITSLRDLGCRVAMDASGKQEKCKEIGAVCKVYGVLCSVAIFELQECTKKMKEGYKDTPGPGVMDLMMFFLHRSIEPGDRK